MMKVLFSLVCTLFSDKGDIKGRYGGKGKRSLHSKQITVRDNLISSDCNGTQSLSKSNL